MMFLDCPAWRDEEGEIECIEEGGTQPTIALLRHLAAALDADVRPDPATRCDMT